MAPAIGGRDAGNGRPWQGGDSGGLARDVDEKKSPLRRDGEGESEERRELDEKDEMDVGDGVGSDIELRTLKPRLGGRDEEEALLEGDDLEDERYDGIDDAGRSRLADEAGGEGRRRRRRRRPSASTVASFQLYTPDEEKAVVRKLDRRLVVFVALLYMLSFLDRSSMSFFPELSRHRHR